LQGCFDVTSAGLAAGVVRILLALAGADTGLNLAPTWACIVIGILHSLVQALWNRVAARFSLFLISTLVLFLLAINALSATW
jgi:hypothetical protein